MKRSKRQRAQLKRQRAQLRGIRCICDDCGVDILKIGDYVLLNPQIWKNATPQAPILQFRDSNGPSDPVSPSDDRGSGL
jgi:hypothetical protein